ncbi:MAG: serine/threonine-protein kinase [Nannocystaceae bacterium]
MRPFPDEPTRFGGISGGAELATRAANDSDSDTARAVRSEVDAVRGTSLGRYIVLGQLGAGGMGVVYAAYDPELDRKVALKVLKSTGDPASADGLGGTDSEFLRTRLLREAQALAKLSHPNVVTVYDVGTIGGDVFVAMAYLDGGTLREWLKMEQRSWREILATFVKAGEGLAAAHRAGLTHRDFKPDNVIVDRDGRVFVLDFGLVHAQAPDNSSQPRPSAGALSVSAAADAVQDADSRWGSPTIRGDAEAELGVGAIDRPRVGSATNSRLTELGSVIGTPAYMAPEQYIGLHTDARTDQYSFCVTLYEALYGERPFRGDSLRSLQRAIETGDLGVLERARGVPEWLRRTVLRGLSVDAESRYDSMADLLGSLRRDRGAVKRRAAAVLGGIALAGAAVSGYLQGEDGEHAFCEGGRAQIEQVWDDEIRDRMKRGFETAGTRVSQGAWKAVVPVLDRYADAWVGMHRQSCEATRVWGQQSAHLMDLRMNCLTRRLEAMRSLTSAFRTPDANTVEQSVKAAYDLPRIDACADAEALLEQLPLPEDPVEREKVESMQIELARLGALRHTNQFGEGAKRLPDLIEQARSLGYVPVLAEARLLYGASLSLQREPEQAIVAERSALYSAVSARAFELAAKATLRLIWDDAYLMRNYDAGARYERHAAALLQAAGEPLETLAEFHEKVGLLASVRGDRETDIRETRLSLEIRRRVLDPDHPDIVGTEANLAMAIATPKEADTWAAVALLRHVEREVARVWPQGHPTRALALSSIGWILDEGGYNSEAIEPGLRAVDLYEMLGQEDTTWARGAEVSVGDNYFDLGELRKALHHYGRVLEELDGSDPDCRWSSFSLAVPRLTQIYLDLGRVDRAAGVANKALDACAATLGVDHPDVRWLHVAAGKVSLRQGEAALALDRFEQARVVLEEHFAGRPWELLEIRGPLGEALQALGRPDEALALHREGYRMALDVLGDEHTHTARAAHVLGRTLIAQGEYGEAVQLLDSVVRRLGERLGHDSLRLVGPLTDLGDALLSQQFRSTVDVARAQQALLRAQESVSGRPLEFDAAGGERIERLLDGL